MDGSSIALLVALVGVIVSLIRIVEHLVVKKKQNGHGVLTKEQAEELHTLYKMHDRYDDNGVPRWFFPGDVLDMTRAHCEESSLKLNTIIQDQTTIRNEQHTIYSKINDLISSQQRVTDRISDLINKLDRQSN